MNFGSIHVDLLIHSLVGLSGSPLSSEMKFNVFILLNGWICLHGVLD